jgi:large subunit ribosomal protein L32e
MSPAAKKTASKPASSAMATKRTLRAKTPKFQRHANHRKARLDTRWKKPRGLHNKQKDNKTASSPKPSSGYRTPVEVRDMHISGLRIMNVATLTQLATVNPATDGVVIASVGKKKQLALLQACVEKKIRVLNHKAEQRITHITAVRKKQQDEHTAAQKHKEEAVKKKTAKKPVDEKLSDEEKKEQQDKIKEEVLTSKSA